MGMYNEVYKRCAKCGEMCDICISQIVDGFGEFYLDDPQSIAEKLTLGEIKSLHAFLSGENFHCVNCGASFSATNNVVLEEKVELFKKLFKV
jgi:transcription elongation factor Elf1